MRRLWLPGWKLERAREVVRHASQRRGPPLETVSDNTRPMLGIGASDIGASDIGQSILTMDRARVRRASADRLDRGEILRITRRNCLIVMAVPLIIPASTLLRWISDA